MRGINKVILLGHLGRDPDIKNFANGDKTCLVSLATSRHWKNKQTGEIQSSTEWHRLVFTHHLVDIAERYLHKGCKVYIEGKLKTRQWKNQLGVNQYTTEVYVDKMQLLDRKAHHHDIR